MSDLKALKREAREWLMTYATERDLIRRLLDAIEELEEEREKLEAVAKAARGKWAQTTGHAWSCPVVAPGLGMASYDDCDCGLVDFDKALAQLTQEPTRK